MDNSDDKKLDLQLAMRLFPTRGFQLACFLLLATSFSNSHAQLDQCDTTAQCLAIYGNQATDCMNSQSDQSICICGSEPCDESNSNPPVSGFPGLFDPQRDLFLAFFDNRPDPDDIHSQAGVATLLADERFRNVDFFSVLGTFGRQTSVFLNSSGVMDLCLGSDNWSFAYPMDSANWFASIDRSRERILSALARGGDAWIMEAGQSNFSADLVRSLLEVDSSIDTNNRIHIVQHSNFNEQQTTPADLSFVQNNTDYIRIPDGNVANNGSPQFNNRSTAQVNTAESLPNGLGECWSEARRVAIETNGAGGPGRFMNPTISAGGFDFSDVVEAMFIFGLNAVQTVDQFFTEFPRNPGQTPRPGSEPPAAPPPSSNSTNIVPGTITPLLLDEDED